MLLSNSFKNFLLLKNKKLSYRNLSFLVIVSAFIAYVILSDRDNVYSLTGETEVLTINFSKDIINQWNVSNATYSNGFFEETRIEKLPEDSYFFPNKATVARLSVIESNTQRNQLLITLTSYEAQSGYIDTPKGEIKLSNYVEIKLPIEHSFLLPFDGYTHIGEDVGQGVDNILLSGQVRIIEKQFFSDKRYVAGDYKLDAGDRLTLFNDSELSELVSMKGFVRISNKGSFDFTLNGTGKVLSVARLGSTGYLVTPSFWPRLTKDPIVAAFTTLFATLFLLMEFFDLSIRFFITQRDTQ